MLLRFAGSTATSTRCALVVYERPVRAFSNVVQRLAGVQMHPDGHGKDILPGGDHVLKFDKSSGQNRRVLLERSLGSFWMMKDLQVVDSKPILASTIDEEHSIVMPTLDGVTVLSTVDKVSIPHYLLRNNRTKDPNSQCTILGISFKEFGYQLVESWLGDVEQTYAANPRVEVARLTITEGTLIKSLLSGIMTRSLKNNTPVERQDRTLVHFGTEAYFKDFMRMHNTLTGYIYVLDGIGRVRWVGSGKASSEELDEIKRCVKNILPAEKSMRLSLKPKDREIRR